MSSLPRRPSLLPGPLQVVLLLGPLLGGVLAAPSAHAGGPLLSPNDVLHPDAAASDAAASEPAGERGGSESWSPLEDGEAAPPTLTESTRELVEERLAELDYVGFVGAEAPVEYYLDPLDATDLDPLHLDRVNPAEFDIPIVVNDMVKKWMVYFLGKGRKYYTRYLMRSTKWMPLMHAEIDSRGMPRDLVYLSMIESGFTTSATSYASAAGLWQFMPATARQYGLRVDWWADERRDPVEATRAALEYLAYLNRLFEGDWWLSWAGYNGGEGRVMRATQRHGTTNFWKIVEANTLHEETENYVPKLIAAAIIGKHPERYGFVGVPYQEPWAYEEVEVPGATGIEVIAKCAGITEEALLEHNPWIRRWALPPEPTAHKIRLPVGTTELFAENFAKVPPEERVTFARHVVKRGESLGSIAKKYSVSTEELTAINHLKTKSKIVVGQEILVPRKGTEEVTLASVAQMQPGETGTKAKTEPKAESKTVSRSHTVRSGETLSGIARKYELGVRDLKALNGLKGDTIYAGQKLKVGTTTVTESTPSSGSTASKASSASSSSGKTVTYSVKSGDTLGKIAERYDCTVSELQSWNGLKGSTIYPGQKLKIKQ